MSDSRPDLVIYGSPVSPFLRKVAGVCSEKEVAFETENVDIFNPPQWFRDISPLKRIPVLRDRAIAEDGVNGTIADSSAICAYIEKKHSAPALYPADAYAHGRALFIEEFADTSLAMAGGMGIFRPIFFSLLQGKEPDLEKARKSWTEDMPPLLSWLDVTVGESGFFVGDALSIADIAVTCVLAQVALVAEMPLGDYPALSDHYERISARPSLTGPFAKADSFVRKTLPTRFDLT